MRIPLIIIIVHDGVLVIGGEPIPLRTMLKSTIVRATNEQGAVDSNGSKAIRRLPTELEMLAATTTTQ
jgi:hypothetical protein